MNIAGVGPVRVRWYFTDQPFLDVPTVYNSRNWLTDKEQSYPAGEVKGASRPYYNGRAPTQIRCTGPFGDEKAWIGQGSLPKHICHSIDEFKSLEWHRKRTWAVQAHFTPKFAGIWPHGRRLAVSVSSTAIEPVSWSQERSWAATDSSTAVYAATWSQERSWAATEGSTAVYAATWSQERSWAVSADWAPTFLLSWYLERLWSVSSSTHDNVTSFTQGTAVAAGSTQGTATLLSNDFNVITSTGSGQGVILPSGNYMIAVFNNNSAGPSSNISIYPPSGGTLGPNSTNTPVTVGAGNTYLFFGITTTNFRYTTLQ